MKAPKSRPDLRQLVGRHVEFFRPLPHAGRKAGKVLEVLPRAGAVRMRPALEDRVIRVELDKVLGVLWRRKLVPVEAWLAARPPSKEELEP